MYKLTYCKECDTMLQKEVCSMATEAQIRASTKYNRKQDTITVRVDKETGKWCVSDFIGVVKSGFETSDEAYEFAVEHFKLIRK